MGFLASDLTPAAAVISPNTPPAKDVVVKAFKIARTDTVASVKQSLPADATVLDIVIYGPVSDAGTTAVVSIGTTSASNELIISQDVKGAGIYIRPSTSTAVNSTNFMKQQVVPLGADIPIYAKYAETGGASTVGSWTVLVYFVR